MKYTRNGNDRIKLNFKIWEKLKIRVLIIFNKYIYQSPKFLFFLEKF